jgi:UPF0755 protein
MAGAGGGKTVRIVWPAGLSNAQAAERLQAAGLIDSARLFELYLALFKSADAFEAGPHLLNDTLSPREIVQRLARLNSRESQRVTLIEGWHYLAAAERLEELEVCSRQDFVTAVRDPRLLQELTIRGESAEGYLFPATYSLKVDSEPAALVRRFVAEARKRIIKVDASKGDALERLADERGWGEHEVLTLAAMVEKEASHDAERPLIASVFLNRLSDPEFRPLRMLQSDPTAAYGCVVEPRAAPSCKDFSGRVLPAMLRDSDNRYNTYRHAGLPPGPISNPGEASIAAVLAPADTEYLYFVATGGGRHTFSRSFDDHRKAIGSSAD